MSRGLTHAYLIRETPSGAGEKLARELALKMVCAEGGCLRCSDCRKARENIHPDIITVDREEGKREISVGQVRTVRADAAVMPNEAERKVYIIRNADSMNPSAQNAMLKILEEPPSHASFLLIAMNPGAMLDTVRSRCVMLSPEPERAESGQEDETAEKLVSEYLSGERLELTSLLFSLERADRQKLESLFTAIKRKIAATAPHSDSAAVKKLLHLAQVCDESERCLEVNVSAGHIIGLMMSELL